MDTYYCQTFVYCMSAVFAILVLMDTYYNADTPIADSAPAFAILVLMDTYFDINC